MKCSPFLAFHFLPLFLLWAWSEMALSCLLVSEDHGGVICEAVVVVFSLAFLYKIVRQQGHSAMCLRFLPRWLGE